jgi:crotonobetainyl-CoA:carnitine CoA-transferase CaiB-like acyl-CoA transferase
VRTAAHAGRDIRLLGGPIRCPGDETSCRAGPALGADTDDVLGGVGFTSTEIARLRQVGIV